MSDKTKFGLVMPKKTNVSKLKKHSVFSDESDEDSRSHKRPKIPQKKISLKPKMKTELVEDPSIYEYDNIYDEMKLKQAETIAPKEKQNSRYIETLMKAADKRKKEYERRMDKKIQAEREKEGDKYKDKEAFVTSSYKKKMEELEAEEERERHENMLNDMMDVTKQKDISGFYRHFLKQTVGEEKIPQFGERNIKKEIVSDEELPQSLTKSSKNIDQDSDGVETNSNDEDNHASNKCTTEDKRKKWYDHFSRNLAGSSKDYNDIDADSDGVEIDTDEDEKGDEISCTKDKKKKSCSNSQSSHSLPKNSKDNKNIDQDSEGIEIDSDEDAKQNKTDKGKKSDIERSFRRDDLSLSSGNSSKSKSKKSKEKKHISDEIKSIVSKNKRIHQKKSSHSSNSDSLSSGNEEDSIRVKKDTNKSKKSDKNNNKHLRHDTSSSSSDDSGNVQEEIPDEKKNKKSSSKKSPKKNIFAKRTIGDVFAEAQANYFQRMALRNA